MEKKIYCLLSKGLTKSSVLVLSELVRMYGYKFSVSLIQMGNDMGKSYETVRFHLKKLEKVGLILIERSSTKKLVCTIYKEKVNEIL